MKRGALLLSKQSIKTKIFDSTIYELVWIACLKSWASYCFAAAAPG